MSEYDDQWLRDELAAAVPTPPEAGDRAHRATAKARRGRRVRVVGVLGAAAVVVAAAVAWNVASGDGGRATDHTRSPALPCLDHTEAAEASTPPSNVVPGGAVAVRLCRYELDGGGAVSDVSEVLTTDAAALANAVNSSRPLAQHGPCTADLGTSDKLVFGYADGTTFDVSGSLFGCHQITIGPDYRAGAEEAYQRFLDRLRHQHDTAHEAADCRTEAAFPQSARVTELVTADLCVGSGENMTQVPIPASDLAALTNDMLDNTGPGGDGTDCLNPRRIVGQTAWGDPVALDPTCSGQYPLDGVRNGNQVWVPSPVAQAILDRLAAEAR